MRLQEAVSDFLLGFVCLDCVVSVLVTSLTTLAKKKTRSCKMVQTFSNLWCGTTAAHKNHRNGTLQAPTERMCRATVFTGDPGAHQTVVNFQQLQRARTL